jgi:hypothetical protein
VFGLKLQVCVELGDGLPKGLRVPDHLADGCLLVGLQYAPEDGGNDGHGVQWDVVLLDPLQIGPRPATILRRAGAFPARTERVAASWVQRQHRFEPEVTDPVIDEVLNVAETLPPMQAQRCKRHVTCVNIEVKAAQPWNSIHVAMDVERVEIGVAPREDNLECGMEGGQGHVATEEEATPDQGADPLHHHPELIDVRWGNCLFHKVRGNGVPAGHCGNGGLLV